MGEACNTHGELRKKFL